MMRTEPKDRYSQAPSAILELVDGPRDLRFAMTAATVARDQVIGKPHSDLTHKTVNKVTRYRKNGQEAFEDMVARIKSWKIE